MQLSPSAKLLHESPTSLIYFQEKSLYEDTLVIIKILRHEYPELNDVAAFENEYVLTQSLDVKGVRRALQIGRINNRHALYLEYFRGNSLKKRFKIPPNLVDFLQVALKITQVLADLHQKNILHQNINPENILINQDLSEIQLIDFSIAKELGQKPIFAPQEGQGDWHYIAPEQTGRMNRALDLRADLYALGVSFYEIITGRLPFEGEEKIALIHAHLAKKALPPVALNKRIPLVLSNIILKLLEKNPEQRYQTAKGLYHDLQKCLYLLENTGRVEAFNLGENDFTGEFKISQKIYGRNKEIKILLEIFEKTSVGKAQFVFVEGSSGVGKSALVEQIMPAIYEKNAYYITGKFDRLQKSVPYYGFTQTFSELVHLLLANSHKISYWKEKILSAVAQNAKVLTDILPNLELIIGKAPEVAELGSVESQNRLNEVFELFLRAIATQEHPLVVFMDEFQWADVASLSLLKHLFLQKNAHFLIIVAYRENHLNEQNNFNAFIEEVKEQEGIFLNLKNLSQADISELICDTLHCSPAHAKDLTELVFEKTQGNAFFVNQFLKSLYEEKLLRFESRISLNQWGQQVSSGEWQWNIDKIRQLNITDNVVELMASKVQKLSLQTNRVLRLAACIGNQFSLEVLSQIYEKDVLQTVQDLEMALQEGLIMPVGKRYKFAHARIHQAVYLLNSETERQVMHRKIGNILENIFVDEDIFEQNLFDIVHHLNIGSQLVENDQEKVRIASLNLRAGEKSRKANDFVSANNYFEKGIAQLPQQAWQNQHELTFKLYRRNAEVAYLLGKYELSERLLNLALQHVRSPLEQVQCQYLLIAQYTLRSKFRSAIRKGLEALRLLGWQLPTPKNIWKSFLKENTLIDEFLEKNSVDSLAHQPHAQDERAALSIKILAALLPVCYLTAHVELYAFLSARLVNLSIEFGNVRESSTGYAHYGNVLGALLKRYQHGYQFGLLATRLHEKYKNLFLICTDNNTFANFVSPWIRHINQSQALNRYAYQASLEIKQAQYTAYTLMFRMIRQFYEGKDLFSIAKEMPKYIQYAQDHRLNWVKDTLEAFMIVLEVFIQKQSLEQLEKISQDFVGKASAHHSHAALGYFYLLKSMLLYSLNAFKEAHRNILLAEKYLPYLLGVFFVSEYNFFHSLILLALYKNEAWDKRTQSWKKIEQNQLELKQWAELCPENFMHKYWLIKAEQARVRCDLALALKAYDQAISDANENGFRHVEALANELAGRFWIENQKDNFAQVYIKAAHHLYKDWGANQKVASLENQYPHFLGKFSLQKKQQNQSNAIDLVSVMKATQALSTEIVLAKLLEKLIKILIENAGADRGLLILIKDEHWFIEAEADIELKVKVLQGIALEKANAQSPTLAVEIVNYVIRTQKRLLLNDISQSNFSALGYIRQQKTKSVLCMPLFHQARVEGVLYLENNLMSQAFTSDHLEVLNMLSTQIMIAIENARLYENLEEKVAARTAELDQRNKEITHQAEKLQAVNTQLDQIISQLDQKNRAVTASINYAKRIQEAMLPSLTQMEKLFEDSFILFRPKDIVSGDFYWFSQKDNKKIIAVADCTGHGVPGAFMSLIGNDLLNEIINLKNILQADLILNQLHQRILEALNQESTDNRDGMDISLCVIDQEQQTIEFAGARNSLVYVQNQEIREIVGDKMSIGWTRFFTQKEFSRHLIPFQKGECFYVFSDGYQDQFGGEKGKKFTKTRLKNLLAQICHLSMNQQAQILNQSLDQWMQDEKQTDDITLLGFRL